MACCTTNFDTFGYNPEQVPMAMGGGVECVTNAVRAAGGAFRFRRFLFHQGTFVNVDWRRQPYLTRMMVPHFRMCGVLAWNESNYVY